MVQLFLVVVINLDSRLKLNVSAIEKVTKVMNVIWLRPLDHERPFLEQSLFYLLESEPSIEWTNVNQS